MPNYANLRSCPKIQAVKPSKRDTEYYRHDSDALQGVRLAVGAQAKTWIMSNRINGKVRSITHGRWSEIAKITLPMLEDAIKGKTPSTALHLARIIRTAFRRTSTL